MSGIKIGHMVKLVPFSEVHMRYNINPYDRGAVIKTNKNQMLDVLVGWRKEVCKNKKTVWVRSSDIELITKPLKDVLKNSTFIKSRRGEVAYVKNGYVYFGLKGVSIELYDRNLCNDINLDYDIMEIYRVDKHNGVELVWARVKHTEKE